MLTATCDSCDFWQIARENAEYGFCHANPRQPFPGNEGKLVWQYPRQSKDDIACGLYEEER